jgi:phage-related protein
MTPDEIRHIVSTAGPALDGVVSASELVGTTIARIDVDSANDALVNINSTSAAITEAIPVVTDTVRQMADTVAQIDTASVNNTMQQAGEALKGVSTFMQGVTDTLASIKKAVIGAFESFKKGASMIASKIAMVASLIWMKSKSLPSMVWSTIKSAVTYLFPSSAWVKTVEAVDEAVAEPAYAKCISSQAEGVDGSTQSGIFANIGKIASLIAVGTAIHDGVTNRGIGMHLVNLVSSKMQGHGRAANGFEDLFTLLCKGVESAVNAVRHYLGMEKWRMFTRYSKAIDDALMEAYEIEEKEMRDGCAPTMQARHEKILACWHTIR